MTAESKPPSRRVTLAEIAESVKMSRSGVSRALRDDPDMSVETCRRVQEVAKRLGFVGDQRISYAFKAIRTIGGSSFRGNLGFVNLHPIRTLAKRGYGAILFENARERAEELGYRLDEIFFGGMEISSKRLQGILEARNISGLLIPPLPENVYELKIDWSVHACVAITHSLKRPSIHRVTPDQFHNMWIAMDELRKRDYRRVAFVTTYDIENRVNFHFQGAYLSFVHDLLPESKIPIFKAGIHLDEEFDRWLARYAPDVIIGCDPCLAQMIEERGIQLGRELGFVSPAGQLVWPGHRLHKRIAHVYQNEPQVARTGIDTLVAQINRRELGVPDVASSVQIAGEFFEGETIRPISEMSVRS